ncbi:MAG: AAA family ATPase [Bacteroidota bacterium]|nr:AAA family ATPase [Bacteroidota bacterium]
MKSEKIDIIILRGAPASGKSQTAKSLSQSFPRGVRLEVDTLRQMVISVDWTNQEEHINMLQVSTRLVYDFLKLGFRPVIVVDTFSGDKMNKYLDSLFKIDQNLSIKIFGLFTTDEELKKRLELRSNGEFKDFGICKKLNDDVLKIKNENEFQVDTTGLLPIQTAEIIYENINLHKS